MRCRMDLSNVLFYLVFIIFIIHLNFGNVLVIFVFITFSFMFNLFFLTL